MSQIVETLADIQQTYDALFVDLWGCVHNGVKAFPDAVSALRAYRQTGGKVVLLTNAPRPRDDVARQITTLGVPDDAWDTIVTSGDSARVAMYQGAVGNKVWFVGNEAIDLSFFEPPRIVEAPVEIKRVPLNEADGVVCTGLFEAQAPPEILRPELLMAREKGLKLLCANPDIVVDRGEVREWCAGALAQLYTEMGGESLYFGKPHPPIYDLARRRLGRAWNSHSRQPYSCDRRRDQNGCGRRRRRRPRLSLYHRWACSGGNPDDAPT